jgi:hypothetical protein
MPAWPSTLPGALTEGYGINPDSAVVRTDMDSGPARVRRRFSRTPTKVPVRFSFTQLEMYVFESWFKLEIASGAAWFTFNLYTGAGFTQVNARFIAGSQGAYKVDGVRGTKFHVSAEFEIDDLPVMTPAELAPYL